MGMKRRENKSNNDKRRSRGRDLIGRDIAGVRVDGKPEGGRPLSLSPLMSSPPAPQPPFVHCAARDEELVVRDRVPTPTAAQDFSSACCRSRRRSRSHSRTCGWERANISALRLQSTGTVLYARREPENESWNATACITTFLSNGWKIRDPISQAGPEHRHIDQFSPSVIIEFLKIILISENFYHKGVPLVVSTISLVVVISFWIFYFIFSHRVNSHALSFSDINYSFDNSLIAKEEKYAIFWCQV